MNREYTTIRKIYAWVGFITIISLTIKGIDWMIDAHRIIAAVVGY